MKNALTIRQMQQADAKDAAKRGDRTYALPIDSESKTLAVPRHAPVTIENVRGHDEQVMWWIDGDFMTGLFAPLQANAKGELDLKTADGCLSEFCQLTDATAEKIVDFAFNWGVLGIWPLRRFGKKIYKEDGSYTIDLLPIGERPKNESPFVDNPVEVTFYGDTIDFWHRMARRVRAILNIKASLDLEDAPAHEDWMEVFGKSYQESLQKWQPESVLNTPWGSRYPKDAIEFARECLFYAVGLWSDAVPVRLVPAWSPGEKHPILRMTLPYALKADGWEYEKFELLVKRQFAPLHSDVIYWRNSPYYPMQPSRLFHVVVLQLLGAMTETVTHCTKCKNPILGSYKTKEGRVNNYCSICRTEERRKKDAERKRERRAKEKGEG